MGYFFVLWVFYGGRSSIFTTLYAYLCVRGNMNGLYTSSPYLLPLPRNYSLVPDSDVATFRGGCGVYIHSRASVFGCLFLTRNACNPIVC